MQYVSKSAEETTQIARQFAGSLESIDKKARVIGLYGELGAGKTTFMKGVAQYFNIKDEVNSPTFVIEKIYELENIESRVTSHEFRHLIHIDAYRIEKSDELVKLGWNEIISDPKNIIFIEWPERIEGIMPKHTKIQFEHLENENERKITIK